MFKFIFDVSYTACLNLGDRLGDLLLSRTDPDDPRASILQVILSSAALISDDDELTSLALAILLNSLANVTFLSWRVGLREHNEDSLTIPRAPTRSVISALRVRPCVRHEKNVWFTLVLCLSFIFYHFQVGRHLIC